MKTDQERDINPIYTISPPLITALSIHPRLVSPQFGLFDDGRMLIEANNFLNNDRSVALYIQAGRFLPVYRQFFTLIYSLVCPNPFWFYITNLIILCVLVSEIRCLLKKLADNEWQILLFSLLFLLSTPIIENFYTLAAIMFYFILQDGWEVYQIQ